MVRRDSELNLDDVQQNNDEIEVGWEELEVEVEEPRQTETMEDSVQIYLREIGQVALLTAEEEVTLAKQIEAGRDAEQRLKQMTYSSPREQYDLQKVAVQGIDARRHLIQANLRLVVSVAKKYIGHHLSFMDLVQEGNIGLMRAVEKFDYRKGNRFSTYATWWIRQAVTRSLAEHGRLIRLPVHLSEAITQLRRTTYQLEQALQREPTPEEIADALGIGLRKVKRMLNAATQPISLERPLGPDGDVRIGEFLADDRIEGPLDAATQRMLHEELSAALEKLPERERTVLQLRYGLHDGKRRTLEEVGAAFGITRERTRQIEADAMRHLRAPDIGQHLRAYLDS